MMKGDGRRVYGYPIPGNVFWRDIGTPRARLEADRYVIELMSFEEKMSSRLEL